MDNDNKETDNVAENTPQPNETVILNENSVLPKKKNNAFKIIILVVLFLAAVSSVAFYLLAGTPSKKLTAALAATGIEYSKSNSIVKQIDENEELFSKIDSGKLEQKFNLTIKEIGGDLTQEQQSAKVLFEGSGVDIDIKSDDETGQYALNWNNIIMGSPFLSFNFYRDDAKTVLSLPELYSKSVYFDNENAYDNFLDSDLSKSDSAFTDFIGTLAQNPETKTGVDYKGILERYCTQNADVLNNFRKSFTVTKADKKSIKLNDNEVICKGYKMTIPSKNISELAVSIKEFANNDEQCRTILSAMSGSKGTSSYINDFNEDIDGIINSNQDVLVNFYVNNNKIAEIELSDSSDTKINVLLKGKDNIFDSCEFSIKDEGSSQGDGLIIKRDALQEGSLFNDKFVAEFSVNGKKSSMSLEGSYNSEDKTYSSVFEVIPENSDDVVKIEANGIITNVENGKNVNIDNLTLSSGMFKFVFTGKYSVINIDEAIEQPQSDVDLFSMNQLEINETMSEIQSNLQKKLFALILSIAY